MTSIIAPNPPPNDGAVFWSFHRGEPTVVVWTGNTAIQADFNPTYMSRRHRHIARALLTESLAVLDDMDRGESSE